jgi:hypothetical protein
VFSITAASVLYVSLTSERWKKGTVASLVEYIVVGCNQKCFTHRCWTLHSIWPGLAGISHVTPLEAEFLWYQTDCGTVQTLLLWAVHSHVPVLPAAMAELFSFHHIITCAAPSLFSSQFWTRRLSVLFSGR